MEIDGTERDEEFIEYRSPSEIDRDLMVERENNASLDREEKEANPALYALRRLEAACQALEDAALVGAAEAIAKAEGR